MKRTVNKTRKTGFTLIELSLSIAFIAILSIIIVLIINNAVSSYRRGIVLNQVNSTGMDIADDIRAAIQNSPSAPVINECSRMYKNKTTVTQCTNDGARNFVTVERAVKVEVGGELIGGGSNVPVFGAFCTGSYSYIWNSGYFFNEDYKVDGTPKAILKYHPENATNEDELLPVDDFRLLKVRDNSRSVCIKATMGSGENYKMKNRDNNSASALALGYEFTVDGTLFEEPVELLSGDSSNNLVLYDLTAGAPTSNNGGNAAFYSVSFVLGTLQGGVNIKAAGNFCATPNDFEVENFDYCAINKFNIAVQATGE